MSTAYSGLATIRLPKNVEGGVAEKILIAPLAWIQQVSVPQAPFTNAGDEITIKQPHVFKPLPNVVSQVATATAVVDGVSNQITAINITNGGSGYQTAPLVTITGGGGTGAQATAVIDASGVVTAVNVTNPGTGYTSIPTVSFSAPQGATYGFMVATLAPQKNKVTSKSVGEIGLLRQMTELDVFLPGSYAELHQDVKHLKNQPLIVLIKDANIQSNLYYQLGDGDFNAWVAGADFDTGTTKDGVKGYTLKLNYDGNPLIYSVAAEPVLLPE